MRVTILLLSAAVLAGPAAISARAAVSDEVVMVGNKPDRDGLRIFGRIREVKEDKVWLIINDGENEGPISVPAKRVKRIEYDLDGRRAELPAGDHLARYKFALWELSLGRREEALFDLEGVVGQPGVPGEAFFALARLREDAGELRQALESYRAYLLTKPTDKDKLAGTREAVRRLEPKVAALPEPDPQPVPKTDTQPGPKVNPKPPPKSTVAEGLEIYPGGWKVVPWADPAAVTRMTDPADGNQFLAVQMTGKGRSAGRKSAIQLRVGTVKRAEIKSAKLMFYVYNPDGKSLPISVAFQTGKNMTFYESRFYPINKKGWSTVTVDLNGRNFKSAATDWAYKTAIKNKNDLKGIIILINTRRKATVFLDYIKFTN